MSLPVISCDLHASHWNTWQLQWPSRQARLEARRSAARRRLSRPSRPAATMSQLEPQGARPAGGLTDWPLKCLLTPLSLTPLPIASGKCPEIRCVNFGHCSLIDLDILISKPELLKLTNEDNQGKGVTDRGVRRHLSLRGLNRGAGSCSVATVLEHGQRHALWRYALLGKRTVG